MYLVGAYKKRKKVTPKSMEFKRDADKLECISLYVINVPEKLPLRYLHIKMI